MSPLGLAPRIIDEPILLQVDPSVWKFTEDSPLFGRLAKELLNGRFVAHDVETIE